ncbi:DUF4450 domain-containing protein [Asticcacaulis excentricus]|uniref:DUF4450 domain-containing protein n=1 Tax=Asticcacaulis excentricus (strain ATCC 15261 / DSM 4724 / KCTC 12464 / NCIMB 9791 / VKM B-1370 / CB 48) TaxID=573065 RepID=E8RV89_ASTEC|nr:DUF4450 domain-containing protein [Asticcacaulis excentricus]ADU15230.1 hypothetical protein Astex_3602 [Asticcacaulis excentricus CB 48]
MPRLRPTALACLLLFPSALIGPLPYSQALAQAPAATGGLRPNIEGQISTPLRYRPDKGDFVIRNGAEYFNRALYGGHTAFRVDAGDKPEFSLYLPGRGGNLRLGLRTHAGIKWINDAQDTESRYRPGEMLYTIRDPLIGATGRLVIDVIADHASEGLLLRASGTALPKGTELVFAYGAGNGQRGNRDGDIGTEKVPISQYFQFKPDYAEGTRYGTDAQVFHADSRTARLTGTVSVPAALKLSDARKWSDAAQLLASDRAAIQVVTGHVALGTAPVYLAIQVTRRGAAEELGTYRDVTAGNTDGRSETLSTSPPYAASELAVRFENARRHFADVRTRVRTETPDPYLDTAMGALNIASDGQWDERDGGGIMHGAIAWRARLLGWRGPYALDALGWHDRARQNFTGWTRKQNTKPIPDFVAPPEEKTNLARNPDGLHTNGDLSNTHYDMNIGFFDALFRHLLWTGDLEYAKRVWPVMERHMAWEKRLFRREYGPDKLPLYEAYAAIWASDDMQYSGGGVAYTTAYNLYHNRMMARLAALIGKDPTPYEAEADLIARGMQTYLWMEDRGAYGEFRDYLGKQMLHPSYGLWSFYHSIDSGAPDARQAARMSADLEDRLRPLPVTGEGVPNDRPYRMLPSSDWMPYSWSINNVVMGENLHTALALWQAGRPDSAYEITRGSVLASFYMGIAPGNVGSMNYLDVYRRESQRDFADGTGVMARTVVEGLFGVRPDALNRTLDLSPGLPAEWEHARLIHPNLSFAYRREGQTDIWTVTPSDQRFSRAVFVLPVRRDRVARLTINGKAATWDAPEGVGAPKLRVETLLQGRTEVRIVWAGQAIDSTRASRVPDTDPTLTAMSQGKFTWLAPKARTADFASCPITGPAWATAGQTVRAESVDLSAAFNDKVTNIFQPGKYRSPRSPFVSLAMPAQGIGAWAGHVNATATIDDAALRQAGGEITIVNGLRFRTPADGTNIAFASLWDNYPDEVSVPLRGQAKRAFLLMAGSTNHMQSRLTNGEVVVAYTDGTTQALTLRNPENWWPIERDYFIDDYQFRLCGEVPVRIDLKTGRVWTPGSDWKGRAEREKIDGGAASVLGLDLNPNKTLQSLTVRAVANEVVIGLMAVSLER